MSHNEHILRKIMYIKHDSIDRHRMEPNEFIRQLHHRIQSSDRGRVTQEQMAKLLGISRRTFVEYLRGGNKPQSMQVILDMLSMLSEEDLLIMMRRWRNRHSKPTDSN